MKQLQTLLPRLSGFERLTCCGAHSEVHRLLDPRLRGNDTGSGQTLRPSSPRRRGSRSAPQGHPPRALHSCKLRQPMRHLFALARSCFQIRCEGVLAAISLATLLLVPPVAMAGAGHDHGDAAPTVTGAALPRFAAVSDLFELVGVLNGKQITLYLDRVADNSPVSDAQIDIEIGGKTFKAAQQGKDEFEVVLTDAPKPGVLPVVATVSVGTDTDLLAGELDVHDAAHADHAASTPSWKKYAGWAAAGIAVLAVLMTVVGRALSSRRTDVGGVA